MIQAGTISTGSACTSAVAGAYWMSSTRRLRSTTLPGVTATSRPTTKSSVPAGGAPPTRRSKSSTAWMAPRTRFMPPLACVWRSTTGLVGRKLPGENRSRSWRAAKATTCSWWRDTPATPWVAASHHSWPSRKDWCMRLKGQACHSGALKRRSWAGGSMHSCAALPAGATASCCA